MGLMPAIDPLTEVRIKLVNTGALVVARVQTPGGVVHYDGDTAIDGVPGTAARIDLQFMDVVGAATGKLLPTGNLRDQFDDIEVTCMDVAMPTVCARADAFELSGYESVEELEANKDFMTKMETVRLAAGKAMGMGGCAQICYTKICCVCAGKGWRHHCCPLFYAMASTPNDGGNWCAMSGFLCYYPWQCCRRAIDAAKRKSSNSYHRASIWND